MENYFNYFTEIEEHFQKRRGTLLILSPLDWALMETWKDAGIPLEAVLRGIDTTFDKWDRRPTRTRKVNSLAFCSQEVLASAEELNEISVGTSDEAAAKRSTGPDTAQVASYLTQNAEALAHLGLTGAARHIAQEAAATLHELAASIAQSSGRSVSLEELEQRLTVMEDKLLAALTAATADEILLRVRTEADRELAPYRSRMNAAQIQQLHKQYIHKRVLEQYKVPRLSLFYM